MFVCVYIIMLVERFVLTEIKIVIIIIIIIIIITLTENGQRH